MNRVWKRELERVDEVALVARGVCIIGPNPAENSNLGRRVRVVRVD